MSHDAELALLESSYRNIRKLPAAEDRLDALLDYLDAHPDSAVDLITSQEETIEHISSRLLALRKAVQQLVVRIHPGEISPEADEQKELVESLLKDTDIVQANTAEVGIQVGSLESWTAAAPGAGTKKALCADASTLTAECTTTMNVNFRKERGLAKDCGVLTEIVDCKSDLDDQMAEHWSEFSKLQWKRIYARYKLKQLTRRTFRTELAHARVVLQGYEPLRKVYMQQLEILNTIHKKVSKGDFQHSGGQSYHDYLRHLRKRQSHIHSLLQNAFDQVFDFMSHILRNLRLAPLEVPPSIPFPCGNSLSRKEESIRRLMKRKPWLFLHCVDKEAVANYAVFDFDNMEREKERKRRTGKAVAGEGEEEGEGEGSGREDSPAIRFPPALNSFWGMQQEHQGGKGVGPRRGAGGYVWDNFYGNSSGGARSGNSPFRQRQQEMRDGATSAKEWAIMLENKIKRGGEREEKEEGGTGGNSMATATGSAAGTSIPASPPKANPTSGSSQELAPGGITTTSSPLIIGDNHMPSSSSLSPPRPPQSGTQSSSHARPFHQTTTITSNTGNNQSSMLNTHSSPPVSQYQSSPRLAKWLCDDCRKAKAQRKPVPYCRNTGCAVSKRFQYLERRSDLRMGTDELL